jgi:aspartokinase/homoserine dehydrogenase 1
MRTPVLPVAIHKFGGAALADAAAIRHVVALVSSATTGRRVIVTSALAGATDALLAAAAQASIGELAAASTIGRELHNRHRAVAHELLSGPARQPVIAQIDAAFAELQELLVRIDHERQLAPPIHDLVLARGERVAAGLVAAALVGGGMAAVVIDATQVMHTDGRFGNAAPDLVRTEVAARAIILPILDREELTVIPGFIGAGCDDAVVTLGRGGSDLTATVLGRALGAGDVTLWKDVPGFLTADPRLVDSARVVAQLDPREASELAYYGAKVLHPRALIPLGDRTTLRIRPFADPTAAGTEITRGRTVGGSPVRAISAIRGQSLVTVAGNGMLGVPGIAARTFGALADAAISVSLISQASSEHSICFTVPDTRADEAEAALRRAFAVELERGEIDEVDVLPGVATVAVVGAGMARTTGIAARVLGAVAEARVNVVAIAQGSSERNISLVVQDEQVPEAVRGIHTAFRLDKVGGGRADRRTGTDVVLLGCGRIGRELIDQIASLGPHDRTLLRIVGVLDRGGFIFEPRGLSRRRLEALTVHKQRGGSVSELPGGQAATPLEAIERVGAHALTRPVLVDLASGDTRAVLLAAVAHGMDLVMANKVPLASDGQSARALLRDARSGGRRVLHEATVGAGLPIIDTVEKLISSGDRVLSIVGCPSGTMGYLFGELGRDRPFSEALRGAMTLGYTEPDPREDLSGLDVARKAIILGRLLGYEGELADVAVESLVPEAMRDMPLADFLAQLETLDAAWAHRVEEARGRGEVLRYRAHATRAAVRVGLVGVPLGSSFASLTGTDNQFVFTTARYRENPLVISGPGAGPSVTAAGVLNDLLRVVMT